jgi:DNA-binding LacI/PurR family transcriptional regulator
METMKKLKSIEDIAILAGVSKSTVSRALNKSPLVSAETRERILAIAQEHDFKPSFCARNLSMKTSCTIAFVNHASGKDECGVSDPFSMEIIGGIATGLHEFGYGLLVVYVDPADRAWASYYLDSGRVDGFILMTSEKKRDHVELLRGICAPFIAWGHGGADYCSVCGDDRKGGALATERLISTGRRRIAFLGGSRVEYEVKERYEGYAAAMRTAGLDPQALVAYGDYSEAGAEREIDRLVERDPRLDAVFANSDYMAIAAIRRLKAMGRRVPDDVAVIGYDDLSIASYVTPKLTTISQQVPLAGRMLARDLVAFLEKGVITHTQMPVELIVRESA